MSAGAFKQRMLKAAMLACAVTVLCAGYALDATSRFRDGRSGGEDPGDVIARSTFGGEPRRVASPALEIRKVDAPAAEPAAPRLGPNPSQILPRSNFRTIGPLRLRRAKRQRSPS